MAFTAGLSCGDTWFQGYDYEDVLRCTSLLVRKNAKCPTWTTEVNATWVMTTKKTGWQLLMATNDEDMRPQFC